MKSLVVFRRLVLVGLLSAVCGCSPTPLKKDPLILWPAPPATPRLKYETTFKSQHDFPKTSGQIAREQFLGMDSPNFFGKPIGIASNGEGLVFVGDMDIANIKIIDFNNNSIHLFKPQPFARNLLGLCYDVQSNYLYAADGASATVTVFDASTRETVKVIGGPDLFKKPTFIAIHKALGRIYVTDVKSHKVVVFDMDGNHLFSFGEVGDEPGQLFGPMGVAIGPDGNIFVAEFFNARIQVFDPDGGPLFQFGERGDREWQLEGPRGLAFDSEGHLFVAEARKAALMVFSSKGEPLMFMGGQASISPLGFTLPTGVAIDQNDRVYVSDSMNKFFSVWQYLSKKYLEKHPLDQSEVKEVEQKLRSKEEAK